MASDGLSPAGVTAPAAGTGAADDLQLLRRYEPVLRFTHGELFLPMSVESYLEQLQSVADRPAPAGAGARARPAERLCTPGELTPARLAQTSARDRAGSLASVRGAPAGRQGVPRVAA